MPVKLSVGLQQKIGQPDYGSLGASCYLEFEIDRSLLESDPDGFQHQVQRAFAACRQSVSNQLTHSPTSQPSQSSSSQPQQPARLAHGGGTATQSQVRAIFAIARRNRTDPQNLAFERFQKVRLEDLSIREASQLIDELKQSTVEACQ